MKRGKPAPDWRCRGEVVFRDVLPGRVPLTVQLSDGSTFHFDVKPELVAGVERIARRERAAFAVVYSAALEEMLRRLLEGK